jgi:hypothetical protein
MEGVMIEPTTPEEDEAFNEIERMTRVKQEIIRWQMEPVKTQQQVYDELRNDILEQVARDIEKFKGFGQDTISSFAIYIRGMKR